MSHGSVVHASIDERSAAASVPMRRSSRRSAAAEAWCAAAMPECVTPLTDRPHPAYVGAALSLTSARAPGCWLSGDLKTATRQRIVSRTDPDGQFPVAVVAADLGRTVAELRRLAGHDPGGSR